MLCCVTAIIFCFILQRRFETLSREKEELSKENQALSGQLEKVKQGSQLVFPSYISCPSNSYYYFFQSCISGKRSVSDTGGEQATKEEKDTKIQVHPTISCFSHFALAALFMMYLLCSLLTQTLEKHLERQRGELRKEKERRLKAEKALRDSYNKIEQVFLMFFIHSMCLVFDVSYYIAFCTLIQALRECAFSLPRHFPQVFRYDI